MNRHLSILGLLALSTSAAFAVTPLQGTCVAKLEMSATGHSFAGAVTSEVFQVTFREVEGKALADFTVKAAMANLTTFKPKRDLEMREHFKAAEHPVLSGEVKGFDWATLAAATEKTPVEIPFTLSFGGGQAAQKAVVTRYQAAPGGGVEFDSTFTVSQKALGYKKIRMMGLMTVKDEVEVSARFILQPAAP